MKKIISILLVALLFSLVSCQQNQNANEAMKTMDIMLTRFYNEYYLIKIDANGTVSFGNCDNVEIDNAEFLNKDDVTTIKLTEDQKSKLADLQKKVKVFEPNPDIAEDTWRVKIKIDDKTCGFFYGLAEDRNLNKLVEIIVEDYLSLKELLSKPWGSWAEADAKDNGLL